MDGDELEAKLKEAIVVLSDRIRAHPEKHNAFLSRCKPYLPPNYVGLPGKNYFEVEVGFITQMREAYLEGDIGKLESVPREADPKTHNSITFAHPSGNPIDCPEPLPFGNETTGD